MSMLAERKQKQRWSLNPRGKQWTDDSTKFGQKMLEKMGWKHGKGLGANEDGITEHVKASYKNDQKGMGYKEAEQWTEHEDNFSRLLSNLNGGSDRDDAFKAGSLHEKAENVKTRINYHKFTKGKDLSRYSEKDLANIFGKKTLKPKNKVGITVDNDKAEDDGMLINKGSITEYFKRKMPGFGKLNTSGVKIGNNGVLTLDSESDAERPTFGFGFDTKTDDKNPKKRKHDDSPDTPTQERKQPEIIQRDKRKRTEERPPTGNASSEDAVNKCYQKKVMVTEGYDKKKSFSEEHVEKIKSRKPNKKMSNSKENEESVSISPKIDNKKKLKNCEGSEEIKIMNETEDTDEFRYLKKSKKKHDEEVTLQENLHKRNISKDREDVFLSSSFEGNQEFPCPPTGTSENPEETRTERFSISTDQIIRGRRKTSKKSRSKSENFRDTTQGVASIDSSAVSSNDFVQKSKKSIRNLENAGRVGFEDVHGLESVKGARKSEKKSDSYDFTGFDEERNIFYPNDGAIRKEKKSRGKLGNVENCGFMSINEEIDDFSEVLETKNIGEKSDLMYRKDLKKVKRKEKLNDNMGDETAQEDFNKATKKWLSSKEVLEFGEELIKNPKKSSERRKNINIEEIGDLEDFKINGKAAKTSRKSAKHSANDRQLKKSPKGNFSDESYEKGGRSRNSESFSDGIFLRSPEENEEFKNKRIRDWVSNKESLRSDEQITKQRKKSIKSGKNTENRIQFSEDKLYDDMYEEHIDFEDGVFLRRTEENGNFGKKLKKRLGGEENPRVVEGATKKPKKSNRNSLEEEPIRLENTKKFDRNCRSPQGEISSGKTEEDRDFRRKRAKSRSNDNEILQLDEKITKKAKKSAKVSENPFDNEEIVRIDEVIMKKLKKPINDVVAENIDEGENYKRRKMRKGDGKDVGEISSKLKKLKTHETNEDESKSVQPIFNIKGKVKKIAEMIDFNKKHGGEAKVPAISEVDTKKKEEGDNRTDTDINLQISTLKRFTKKLMEVSSKIDEKPMALGVVNPGFDPLYNKVTVTKHVLNTIEESNEEVPDSFETNERKNREPRLIIEYENGVHRPIFEEVPPEIKTEQKGTKRKHDDGIENPCFVAGDEPQGIVNPALDISDTDLILNVTTTPILKCERSVSRPARKNVRFSNRNEERIIPNNHVTRQNNGFVNNGFFDAGSDDRSFLETNGGDPPGSCGVDNACFDARSQRLREKVETMSKGIENCQAELDNDINELRRRGCGPNKHEGPIGVVGMPVEGHAQVAEGVRLSFRNVRFGKSPHWMSAATTQAKKSYKHLIRGDIIVAFKNSNLHQIDGYGVEEPKRPVW